MACKTCGKSIEVSIDKELSDAINMARMVVASDGTPQAVYIFNGKYYTECYSCWVKAGSKGSLIQVVL